jgi:hypothetical protein
VMKTISFDQPLYNLPWPCIELQILFGNNPAGQHRSWSEKNLRSAAKFRQAIFPAPCL